MGYFAGTTSGIGTPTFAPSPFTQPSHLQAFAGLPIGGYGSNVPSSTLQPFQLLQLIPQQLQQVQILQQQQLLHLQQLLQLVPAQLQQLQQLQQLIQVVPQQIQQLQQWQPAGQAISGPFGFGLVPPAFGQIPSHVM